VVLIEISGILYSQYAYIKIIVYTSKQRCRYWWRFPMYACSTT